MTNPNEEQSIIEEQKPRIRRFPTIILCKSSSSSSSTESSEENSESSEVIEIPKYIPTFKRKTIPSTTIISTIPNIFKQEITSVLRWSGMDTYEILAEDLQFKTEQLMRLIRNKNHIAIIVEDEEKNRYGGYINTNA